MVAVAEWRRIPAGAADVARFAFEAPPGGVGQIRVRLLRRRRPDFSHWVGEAVQREPELLASVESGGPPATGGERWRVYGLALAAVKAYPEALQALARAQQADGGNVETRLAFGRVYLDDGDLLAAREQFRLAASGDPLRGRAWEGAVLRRMGQPDQAAALLEPLARRFPRDLRLRFELGSAYLAALRNSDAAREFEAMLDVDPIDISAHYNLMLCLQRLNRLTDARREETIYRLLRREPSRVPEPKVSLEDRPLHLHRLEPLP
jgi:tetratricopeptide (TPR) repeat protein